MFLVCPMGCSSSKLEDLEALALCRSRCDLLAQAISHRYALADAHAAYAESLRSVGVALHRVLDGGRGVHPDNSPVLTLPGRRKGDSLPTSSLSSAPMPPLSAAAISTVQSHSRSQSGSHIHFHSDDSDSDDISPLHSEGDSPVHLHSDHRETLEGGPTNVNLHYAKSNPPPPSVSIEQRVGSHEQVQYGSVSEPPSSSYPYGYAYATQNPNSYSHPMYADQPNYYGFFGSSSPPPEMTQRIPADAGANSKASASRVAPPPPSPPRTSAWDFLNPFEAVDSYYQSYSPSRSSKEVREDEGIPDLEEDEQEVIKEAYGDQKFVASKSSGDVPAQPNKSTSVEKDDVVGNSVGSSSHHPGPKDDDVVVVEKNVVRDELQKPVEVRRSVVAPRRYHNVSEVASEIRVQFEGAAELTKELAKMLEVGKHPYSSKGCASAVSSRMLCVIPVSISKDEELVYVEDKVMSTGNLSSTLQKLYIWERKLLDEVRVEEKMRLLHDRKTKKLQRLDERGAETHKIDATQKLIRKLSTQIMIAIQVVNSISSKINDLRDSELWPQIYELIQGYAVTVLDIIYIYFS